MAVDRIETGLGHGLYGDVHHAHAGGNWPVQLHGMGHGKRNGLAPVFGAGKRIASGQQGF